MIGHLVEVAALGNDNDAVAVVDAVAERLHRCRPIIAGQPEAVHVHVHVTRARARSEIQ